MKYSDDIKDLLGVIGTNLYLIRQYKGLSIIELSRKSNCSRLMIGRLENGEQDICYETLLKLSKGLDINFTELFVRFESVDKAVLNRYIEDNYLEIFTTNLKREIYGDTQLRASHITGMDVSNFNKLINGRIKNPRVSTIYKLSLLSNHHLEELFMRGELS